MSLIFVNFSMKLCIQGIGYNRESTGATKVDGSVVTWQNAVDAMNTALQNAGSKWRYELKGALPTLRKQ